MPPIITGLAGYDPILGEMRTVNIGGGTAADYTFNSAEFTVGVAGLVSLKSVPSSKLDTTMDIVDVTGASVTLEPNTAYKIYATSQAITLNANPPAAGKWAHEGHLEIFTAGTGYVVTGTNVVLANALEPDSVNNCTVRFHDGIAIIAVEDHIAGYIVVNGATSGAGSLAYGLSTSTNEYIAVDASLNGQTLDMGGATTNGEKHVVGNGYAQTIISGGISCTSKTTFSNLGMNGVSVLDGTATLGDVFIPAGGTVSVSGGGLAVEKVTGNGGTINLGGSNVFVSSGGTAYANGCHVVSGTNALRTSRGTIKLENCVFSGNATALNQTLGFITASSCIFVGNSSTQGGAVYAYYGSGVYSGCVFSANSASSFGGAFQISDNTTTLVSCTFSDNVSPNHADALGITGTGKAIVSECSFGPLQNIQLREHGNVTLVGSNLLAGGIATRGGMNDSDTVTISSGAIVDLTGNTNSTPINPGGVITLYGGAYPNDTAIVFSSGASSGSRTFEDLEVHGASITNLGLIYGATVYSNEGDDHNIYYTENGGATVTSVTIAGATEYAVPGALVQISGT